MYKLNINITDQKLGLVVARLNSSDMAEQAMAPIKQCIQFRFQQPLFPHRTTANI